MPSASARDRQNIALFACAFNRRVSNLGPEAAAKESVAARIWTNIDDIEYRVNVLKSWGIRGRSLTGITPRAPG